MRAFQEEENTYKKRQPSNSYKSDDLIEQFGEDLSFVRF